MLFKELILYTERAASCSACISETGSPTRLSRYFAVKGRFITLPELAYGYDTFIGVVEMI